MAKNPDDDLFAASTMSIGDHLEELRAALFRSVLGLMVGFAIGLSVATYVVDWIKAPLTASLEKFYIDKSIEQLAAETGDLAIIDEDDPTNVFIRTHRLVYEKQFIELNELTRQREIMEEFAPRTDAKPKTESDVASKDAEVRLASATTSDAPRKGPRIVGPDKVNVPGELVLVTRIWKPIQTVVKALNAQEVFMIWMKAALVVGAIISSPYVFLQIWNFVAAGLYPNEKRYVHMYLPFSLGLFLAGAALCFYFVIPQVLNWLFSFNRTLKIDPDPRINEWIGFALFLPLGFGISFQLPLVMLLLNRIGLLSIELYIAKWRIAILVIFVISMVLTPADPVSMLFMAVPLTGLYFLGIGMCRWMPRGKNPFEAAYEP